MIAGTFMKRGGRRTHRPDENCSAAENATFRELEELRARNRYRSPDSTGKVKQEISYGHGTRQEAQSNRAVSGPYRIGHDR